MAQRSSAGSRSSIPEVLRAELERVRGWTDLAAPDTAPAGGSELRPVYAAIAAHARDGEPPLSALCLSGGGIRSATFNLGVLQGLARAGVLSGFDYVSTVSGGGYVGCWLQAWLARERARGSLDPLDEVTAELCRPAPPPGRAPARTRAAAADPLAPEARPVERLRELSNYLTPRRGLLSGDTWTVVAIVLRNLVLNWLVIVPVIAGALMIPQAAYVVAASVRQEAAPGDGWPGLVAWVALLVAFASSVTLHWARSRGVGAAPDGAASHGTGRRRADLVTAVIAVGAFATATLLVVAAVGGHASWRALPGAGAAPEGFWDLALRAGRWTVGLPAAGLVVARLGRRWRYGERVEAAVLSVELAALACSGAVAALVLAWLMGAPWDALALRPQRLTALGVPALLLVYVLARALYVGLVSRAHDAGVAGVGGDGEREWWARITGALLRVAVAWAAASALVLVGTRILSDDWGRLEPLRALRGPVAALGGVAGALSAFLGRSPETGSGRVGGGPTSRRKELLLRAATLVAVICVLLLLAAGTAWLGRAVNGPCFLLVPPLPDCTRAVDAGRELLAFLGVAAGLALVAVLAGWIVNVNRFSLHAMYRNRLARAYLGASNPQRRPDAITGFDPADTELHLAALSPAAGNTRLFPIVNATLNVLRGDRLAFQERRAESFSMTPLFCGSVGEGYRPTESYGGPRGLSLATAMAVSGAAANPNMGYVSSPALTFLMALLDARLGVWLANPNANGDRVASSAGPRHATTHLVRELLGATTRDARYVNLSDGGHFDNLGLYEVVLRRCRVVVVSDAGCDARCGFADLGNAIRRIRVDFGVPIRFDRPIELKARDAQGRPPRHGLYCAVGTIAYSEVDGPDAPDGTLVYLKPTLAPCAGAPVPYDVRAYATASSAFPHESTVDQWFSESQFESYRALGEHHVRALAGDRPLPGLAAFVGRVRQHAHAPAREEPRFPPWPRRREAPLAAAPEGDGAGAPH